MDGLLSQGALLDPIPTRRHTSYGWRIGNGEGDQQTCDMSLTSTKNPFTTSECYYCTTMSNQNIVHHKNWVLYFGILSWPIKQEQTIEWCCDVENKYHGVFLPNDTPHLHITKISIITINLVICFCIVNQILKIPLRMRSCESNAKSNLRLGHHI
jgi:hypothetical protein